MISTTMSCYRIRVGFGTCQGCHEGCSWVKKSSRMPQDFHLDVKDLKDAMRVSFGRGLPPAPLLMISIGIGTENGCVQPKITSLNFHLIQLNHVTDSISIWHQ